MADKKLTITAGLDTTAFDASVKKMQQDLAKINAPAARAEQQMNNANRMNSAGVAGPNGNQMSAQAQDAFKKATASARVEVEKRLREEKIGQDNLNKSIREREQLLDRLVKKQNDLNKGSQEELRIRNTIQQTQDSLKQKGGKYAGTNQGISSFLDARDKMNPAAPQPQNPAGGGADMKDLLKQIGGLGAIAGLVTKTISTGLSVYRGYGEAPINASVNQGSAMAGTFGSELGYAYGGRSGIESAYGPEKMRAQQLAQANLANRQKFDTASIYGTIGGAGAAGAIGGSFFGPLGTLAGGVGGIAAGTAGALMNPRMRARMLGEVSPTYKKEYESMNAKEYAENYQSSLSAEKQKDPLKTMALEDYQTRYQRNLEFQRATGLNYNSFHGKGGFREQSINAGFMDDQAMGMSGSILGAGGSTRSAQGNSVLGLQMQRGLGMSNAGSILGQISGGMGSASSTRDATIKLLSEGTRLGLDASQFREENRKFSESAAEVISRSGASTGDGVDSVLDRFGKFFTDKSSKGIDAGKSAYEAYQSITSSTSGPTGAMRLAGMMKDSSLGGMSGTDRGALMQLPSEQLSPDNPTVQDIASRNGMTPQDLISKMNKVNKGGVHRLARADELQDSLMKSTGGQSISDNFAMSPQIKAQFGEYRTLSGLENPALAKDPRALTEFAEGSLSSGGVTNRSSLAAGVNDKLNNKDTGIAEDRTVQQNAEASRLMLENFQKLGPTIGASAESIGKFNDQLSKTVDIISKMPEGDRNNLFSKMFPQIFPSNQTQGGKASK